MTLHFHLQYAFPITQHCKQIKEQHEKRLNNQSYQEYKMVKILLIILLMENTVTEKPYHDII